MNINFIPLTMRYLVILFALYFSILSVAPNFQGSQVLKLSVLIDHYKHDSRQTHEDFISFLMDHYANSSLPNDKEHHSLPFKSITSFGAPVLIFQPISEPLKAFIFVTPYSPTNVDVTYLNLYAHSKSSNIFHPPKLS
jgi:hypothetical protein